MRRLCLVLPLLGLAAAPLAAQSGQFAARGLGIPAFETSTAAIGAGGAFGLFDTESALNPAALARVGALTASVHGVQDYRTSINAAGEGTGRSSRFSLLTLAGPVARGRYGLGLSIATYASRDFALASQDTVILRGVPVAYSDTFTSTGGITDIRGAGAIRLGQTRLGVAIHVLPGSIRQEIRRTFEDTTYQEARQAAQTSFLGWGASLGAEHEFSRRLAVSAMLRVDGSTTVLVDSVELGEFPLPLTVAGAVRARPADRFVVGAQVSYRTWGDANAQLQAVGAPGAGNTLGASLGGEFATHMRTPAHLPLRFGVRYNDLPFLLEAGAQPHEVAASIGTGVRFARQRAGVDISAERVWRSDGTGREDRSWQLYLGASVRP